MVLLARWDCGTFRWDFTVCSCFFFSIYIGRYKENYDILEEIIAKTWLVPCFFEGSVFFCESRVIRSQS
jgi:hypothetical protein